MSFVVGSYDHTLCLDDQGRIWAFGKNEDGQLGIGEASDMQTIPRVVQFEQQVISVACGWYHSIFADIDGRVFGFGLNLYGELGVGDCKSRVRPCNVPGLPPIFSVHCGLHHTVCLDTNGSLWSFGRADDGQLGFVTSRQAETRAQQIPSPNDINWVSCGGYHTFCMNDVGTLFCFGLNSKGQLGLGDFDSRVSPVKFTATDKDIIAIACGKYHTMVLGRSGDLYSFGDNEQGQLGIKGSETWVSSPVKVKISPVHSVSCGYDHTMAIGFDGALWVFGSNKMGQLGKCVTGEGIQKLPVKVSSMPEIESISSGGQHSVVKEASGAVWVTGRNDCCQLGIQRPLGDFAYPKVPHVDQFKTLPEESCKMIRSKFRTKAKSARK